MGNRQVTDKQSDVIDTIKFFWDVLENLPHTISKLELTKSNTFFFTVEIKFMEVKKAYCSTIHICSHHLLIVEDNK